MVHLEAGNSHICGVNGTNHVECWQWPEWRGSSGIGFNHENFTMEKVAVGGDFLCGLSNKSITCLGSSNSTVIGGEPKTGTYRDIAAGFRHVCAIRDDDGGLTCWGEVNQVEIPKGSFKGIALGENRSCGLRDNGRVVCWGQGQNSFSLPEALMEIQFLFIEAKRNVFCGVSRSHYSLHCWGSQALMPNVPVFDEILPGPCTNRTCSGRQLPGSGDICGIGNHICEPNDSFSPASPPPSQPVSPPPPGGVSTSSGHRWNAKRIALLVVGCVGTMSFVLVAAFFVYRHSKCKCRVHDSGRLDDPEAAPGGGEREDGDNNNHHQQGQEQEQHLPTPVLEKRLSQLASMGNAGHLEEFSLQVLIDITNNFSEDHKIGSGSFGSVYQGKLEDGREVAIKRAEVLSSNSTSAMVSRRQEDRNHAFTNELESLSRLHHRNLVRLLGFCEDCNELVLVYEFMSNGTLHEHLHTLETSPLRSSWSKRIKVALDAARGIEYLHIYAVPPIIHRDIKSSNILLNTTWTAKVSDFGLSLMGPTDEESHLSLRAAGTFGYIDPEYYRLQKLTPKSDVFSFGVVLLEILSGCRAIHKNENGQPRHVVDFVVPYILQDEIHRVLDPKVPPPTPYEIEAVAYVGYLAADCVDSEGRNRPTMSDIVSSLDKALNACKLQPTTLSRSSTHSSI